MDPDGAHGAATRPSGMPDKLKAVGAALWRLPCKSVLVLLLAIVLWEGEVKGKEALPTDCLLVVLLALVLVFFDRGLPVKVCVALVAVNLIARDNYPFSHFPMYDRFTDHTFYVYVTDRNGDPVALQTTTSIRSSRLKKPYDRRLDQVRKRLGKRKRELTVEERRDAGEEALTSLYADSSPEGKRRLDELSPITLQHVDIYMKDGDIDVRPADAVAQMSFPPKE